jgi:hypothetical protein
MYDAKDQGTSRAWILVANCLTSCTVAAVLAGCGGSQPPIGASGAIPQTSASTVHVERDGSWMLPQAKSDDLLYVTNYSSVSVFTYPQGKLVGTLKSFFDSVGGCVDAEGNVFVTNDKPQGVYEYAHGGTKRIAFYRTTVAGAVGCAISPTNGDLAISGFSSYVEIYKGAQGKPVTLHDSHMFSNQFDTYDDNGDLFVLGLRNPKGHQQLSELPSGSTHFESIKADANIYDEGGIQWSDGYLTAVSNTRKTGMYQFQVTGTKAHEVSATTLGPPAYIVLQYFIDGSTVIVPNLERSGKSNVLYYNYPSGGQPTLTLTQGIGAARGVVVSHAQ